LRFAAAHAPGPPRAAKRQPDPAANRRTAASSPLSWAALEKLPISPRPSARAAGLVECCCNKSRPVLLRTPSPGPGFRCGSGDAGMFFL
jgi:hypothetical protein